jgi:hypothetical protein
MTKNYYLTASFGLSLLILIVSFSLYYIELADAKNLLVIHFKSLGGVDFLGSKWDALAILFSGLIITVINFLLAILLYNRQRLLSYLAGTATLLLSLLILLAITVIIIVN